MLKIPKQVDYGIQFLTAVSRLKEGQCLSVNRFAEETRLSFLFLQKIVQQLKRAGLIASIHGPKGGYRLTKPLLKISLMEVIEAIEGAPGITACARPRGCARAGQCSVEHKLKELNYLIIKQFQTISVADFTPI